ncbi:hypothetical protein F4810DRAFT_654079 [Camillea tinctor]|nr:hypothetical protein F4810DRAFT_654079 [Camillea tinctor]
MGRYLMWICFSPNLSLGVAQRVGRKPLSRLIYIVYQGGIESGYLTDVEISVCLYYLWYDGHDHNDDDSRFFVFDLLFLSFGNRDIE